MHEYGGANGAVRRPSHPPPRKTRANNCIDGSTSDLCAVVSLDYDYEHTSARRNVGADRMKIPIFGTIRHGCLRGAMGDCPLPLCLRYTL